jgi:hypothetical protein
VIQQAGSLLSSTQALELQQDVLQLYVWVGKGGGTSQSAPMVNDDGSLDTAQLRLMRNCTTQLMAKADLKLRNHACGKSV